MASKRLTHVKSPLVLVYSKGVEKLLSGLNVSWMRAHCANGISAHRSLRDETVVIYIYISLAKLSFTSISSHKSFPFSKKAKRNKSLSIVRLYLSINSFGKIPREIDHQSTPAFLELKWSFFKTVTMVWRPRYSCTLQLTHFFHVWDKGFRGETNYWCSISSKQFENSFDSVHTTTSFCSKNELV